MIRTYVLLEELAQNPSQYSNRWIQSVARLKSNPFFSRVQGGPKYLLNLESPPNVEIRLTIWEKAPNWVPFQASSPELWAIMAGADNESQELRRLFQQGVEVFFEGYAIFNQGILWINIQDILIVDPSIGIGPREVMGAMHCPRIYYLSYVKNITRNFLKIPNKRVSKGNLVHYITQQIVVNKELPRLSNLPRPDRNELLRQRVWHETDTTFRIDAALHHLAETPLEDVQKISYFNLKDLFDAPEIYSFFEGKTVQTERQINLLYGFNGVTDFQIDGKIPMEMKTSHRIYPDHILQLKVYLLASYLETGNRIGYLLYSQKASADGELEGRHIYEFVLSEEDIRRILYARHKALLMRKGLSLPTTHNRDCTGCEYATEPGHRIRSVYPPCPFYCQTERYWDCTSQRENGEIARDCALFDICPMKFSYFNTATLDHCSKMRKAIMAESSEMSFLSRQLQDLPKETLTACGQQVDHLRLDGFRGYEGIFTRSTAIPSLDVVPGDSVIVSTPDKKFRYAGFLVEYGVKQVSVRFSGAFHEDFFTYPEYVLVKDYHEKEVFRYLLKAIDYTQRNRNVKISYDESRKRLLDRRNVHSYDPQAIAEDLRKKRVVALQSPCQISDTKRCADIARALARPSSTLIILKNPLEIEEFVSYYPKSHELLILNKEEQFSRHPRVFEIGEDDTPEEIATKFSKSPIFVTDMGFLKSSHLFEFLKNPARSVYFDYVIVTGAEQCFEPFFFYLRNFGYHLLMIGDAYRVAYPVRSEEARHLGLSFGPFERMVAYESYFNSDDFSVYAEPYMSLPLPIINALKKSGIDLAVQSEGGSVTFIDVQGTESKITDIPCRFLLKMGETPLQYTLEIAPDQPLDSGSIEKIKVVLSRESIDHIQAHSRIQIGAFSFLVTLKEPQGRTPDSGDNVDLIIRIPVQFSEALQELLYSNEQEVRAVVDLIRSDARFREDTVIITPFISQASRIREALFNEGFMEVPVMVPLQVSGRSYPNVILSLVNANEERIYRYPLTDPKTLYTMLTSASERLVIIGNRAMVEQSRVLSDVIRSSHQ